MGAEFTGNFAHTIDAKGRITIPAAYREALGERFTIGLNSTYNAVALYPMAEWEKIRRDLERIPRTDRRGYQYKRLITSNSFVNETLDAQGRALLRNALRDKVGLKKTIRFVGMGEYLEVWDEESYLAATEIDEKDEELLDYVNDVYFRPVREDRQGEGER